MLIFARDVFVVNANDANARAVVNIAAMNRSSGVRVCRSMSSDAAIDRGGEIRAIERAIEGSSLVGHTHTPIDRGRVDRPRAHRPSDRPTSRGRRSRCVNDSRY